MTDQELIDFVKIKLNVLRKLLPEKEEKSGRVTPYIIDRWITQINQGDLTTLHSMMRSANRAWKRVRDI